MTPTDQFLRLSEDAELYSADARAMLRDGNLEAAQRLHAEARVRFVAATKVLGEIGNPGPSVAGSSR